MYTPQQAPIERPSPSRRSLSGKLAAVGLTGLLVGSAVAIGSIASAGRAAPTTVVAALPAAVADEPVADEQVDPIDDTELSPEDEAVWQRFADCLTENGVDPADTEEIDVDIDDERLAACTLVLAELGDDVVIDDGESAPPEDAISPEDQAVFDRYDRCLIDNGVPVLSIDPSDGPISNEEIAAVERALDAASEPCDPILDEISDEWSFGGFELSDADAAVFERFDECLGGLVGSLFEDGDSDEVDSAFADCEPILDELNEDVFGDCDEGDDEATPPSDGAPSDA